MTTLTGMSRKARQRAARRWAQWRNAGHGSEVTARQAAALTGLAYFERMHPDRPVRLVEVAIRAEQGVT